jgi:hypothetical protein
MADCHWVRVNDGMVCTRCHRALPFVDFDLKANCPVPGLGDRLASALDSLGFDKTQGCGCESRQAALNRFEARLRSVGYPRGVWNSVMDFALKFKNQKRVSEKSEEIQPDGRHNYWGAEEESMPNPDLLPERFIKAEGK